MGTYVGTLNGIFTAAGVPITATYSATTQRVTFPFVFNSVNDNYSVNDNRYKLYFNLNKFS